MALSLIAALQDSAAVRGPVIMDYPFGRLDTENTAHVVAALPRMARQVILLSFDGEFDRRAALQALGTNLVAEYELGTSHLQEHAYPGPEDHLMADLKNIALTIEATQTATELKQWLGITEQTDPIRLGFAYAIRHHLDLTRDETFVHEAEDYDTGGLDEDGLMAETVQIYYPEPNVMAEPYRAVEILMNKGLRLLGNHWRDGLIGSVSDLVTSDF